MDDLDVRTVQRFFDKVGPPDENGCWPWKAAVRDNGYGYFWLDGKGVPAHRVMASIAKDEGVPEGWYVYHTCGNRSCVAPDHLYLSPPPGTQAQADHGGGPD